MQLWRISPVRNLADAYRAREAGRWNWASREVLYTSATPELAVLEALAHRAHNRAPHWLCRVELPESADVSPVGTLPRDWKRNTTLTRRIGNAWVDDLSSAALRVPSALCPHGFNVLLNPHHPAASGLRMRVLGRFDFDRRLLRGS